MRTDQKVTAREKRKQHIRKSIRGNAERPRLSVFRSSKHIYAQIIDDDSGITLVSASSLCEDATDAAGSNKDGAAVVGKLLGTRALAANVTKVVFDRNGYKYHGRVAALADAAREAGLEF
jgi:large subunit ribosomal protein L18